MPAFDYKALSSTGTNTNGVIEAEDVENASALLLAQGLYPTSIDIRVSNLVKRKIVERDVLMFIKQLQTLMRAGIPLLSGLQNLEQSEKNEKFKDVIHDMWLKLNQGQTLSQALGSHPKIFRMYIVQLVNAGETTGRLDEVLDRVYTQLYFEYATKQQIKSATRYPIIIIATTIIAMLILNIWVIPVFGRLYENFKAELPLPTQIILGISNFTRSYWYLVIGSLIASVFGIKHLLTIEEYKLKWDEKKLKLPVFGKIWANAAMSRFARGFALAYKSGIPMNAALDLVAGTVMNSYYEKKIRGMVQNVEKGMSLTASAIQADMFNPILLQMISVGENSGSLDELMIKMADIYQDDIENDVKTIGQQIEPYLLIFLGIGILILAAGVFMPIWNLANVAIKG